MSSLARPRLITQDSVVAQHPDDDRAFRQSLYLVARPRLLGGRIVDHGRTWPAGIRTCHRAAGQPEQRDQQGGGRWR